MVTRCDSDFWPHWHPKNRKPIKLRCPASDG